MMPRKALIIAYSFAPISYAGTFRTVRFCKFLPENGWVPVVLTIKPGKDLFIDESLMHRIPKEVKIYRTPVFDPQRMYWSMQSKRESNIKKPEHITSTAKPLWYSRIVKKIRSGIVEIINTPDHNVFWIPFALIAGILILLKERCEIIYSSSPPHSSHITAFLLSMLFHKPWIADMRDPILDNPFYQASKFKRRVDTAIERMTLTFAHKVLLVSQFHKSLLETRYSKHIKKMVFMPNGYDPHDIANCKPFSFDRFTIIYSGSFPELKTPEFFLKSLSTWIRKKNLTGKEIQVLIFGPNSDSIQSIIKSESLEQIVLAKGYKPQDEIFSYLKGAHAQLLLVGFEEFNKGTVTSKVFSYMASKRPILAIMPHGDASDIVNGYPMLEWVDSLDSVKVSNSLDRLYDRFNEGNIVVASETQIIDREINLYSAPYQTSILANLFSDVNSLQKKRG